jgi:hypothetical protein
MQFRAHDAYALHLSRMEKVGTYYSILNWPSLISHEYIYDMGLPSTN